jgi:hypothetical protein
MVRMIPISLLTAAVLFGCAGPQTGEAPPVPSIENFEVGPWTNIHRNNPDLVGVRVQQFPDCQYETKAYEGKHPAMIIYVFKNGKAHQLEYNPDGTVESGFWWDVSKDDSIWDNLDRSVAESK